MGDPSDKDYWTYREETEREIAAEVEACLEAEAQHRAYLESTKQAEVRYDSHKRPVWPIRRMSAL